MSKLETLLASMTPAQRKAATAVLATMQTPKAAKVNPVAEIAKAQATLGKVVCETTDQLAIARECGIKVTKGATRFTLSCANIGWVFVGKECVKLEVTAARAAKLRTMIAATRKVAK
jgi:hypothetical protein